MKNNIFLSLFLLAFFSIYAQKNFKRGYYINNGGEKILGYINDEGWSNSPEKINFKKSLESTSQIISTNQIKEFEISGISRFKKFKLKVYDKNISDSNNRKLIYEEKYLFLNTLLKGKTSLYMYNGDNNLSKTYLVENEEGEFLQLLNFNVNINNKRIVLYSTYKEDLKLFLDCKNLNFENLKYNQKRIADLIEEQNKCKGSETEYYSALKEKVQFHVIPKLGISYNSFSIKNKSINYDETINGFGYFIATELEVSLPFNKRNWSIIVEPSYTANKLDKKNAQSNPDGISVEDSRFQVGFGLRKYFSSGNNKFYTTVSFLVPFYQDLNIDFSTFSDTEDILINLSPSLSLGYKINNKIYIDLNFRYSADLTASFDNKDLDYSSFSTILSVGYKLF